MRLALILIVAFVVLQCIPESEAGIGKIGKKANKAVEAFKKLKEKLEKKIGFIKNECQKFFKKAKESIKNAIASVKKEVEATGDSAIKVTFKKIYEGLDKARKKLDDVSEIADKKFYEAMKKADEMFFSATSQIEEFNKKQRKIIEKKKEKEKALEILDNFVAESSEIISSCSDAALDPIKKLYEDTKAIIKGSVDKLEAIIRQCEKCVVGDGGMGDKISCVRELLSVSGDQFYQLGKEITKLKDKLLSGVVKQLLNLLCIGKTRTEVEINKKSTKDKISKLK